MRGPDAYPTVSGVAAAARVLSARHPDLVRMRLAGESRTGRPLWLLSVGHGRRHALVVGGAHADEQAGGATVLWLAEQAVADRHRLAGADLTWDFLLCLDPDGTVLNETGPAGPRPPAVHFRHTYHPAAADRPGRPERTAPGGELPETYALLALVDELRPFVRCSLHGTDVGGAWVRLTGDVPGLAEPFGKYAAELDIPVQAGTYDALFWECAGPGVYVVPEPFAGGPERDPQKQPQPRQLDARRHPQRPGGVTALVEVPMWATRRVADPTPHPDPALAVRATAARLRKDGAALAATLERARPLLVAPGPADAGTALLLGGVEQAAAGFEPLADAYDALAADLPVPLTLAHVAGLDIAARRLPLRAAGMLLRLLDEQPLDDCDPAAEPARLRARLERRLDAGARELVGTADARWVPVYEQVELQARTVLATVDRLL
ncbi:M14 family zinc carboxypeptidase [Actinacidiphila epipremni]|uniref:Hydroxylacyl-CoA dehydrogenase n=1 Tax=Actinacidiphila epipremni TaxID=2053013 RepID=A0ABX0ZWJ2_9ACTN|nr:M14 family zinc carboxypeptidase [Actinacidiphila epipremni]NJP47037.1 hydroxylacyl-CoA dehydrogenase [Actinacidiphila epipremni]